VPILHHAADVQVFDADGMEAPRQVGRELVQGVQAHVGDAGMKAGQPGLGL